MSRLSEERELLRLELEACVGRLVSGWVHELRNPLNAILSGAQLVEERGEEEALRARILPVIRRSALSMGQLFDEIEGHRPDQHGPPPLDLAGALRSCLQLLRHPARSLRVEIRGGDAPIWVWGEPGSLYQILLYLLERALHRAEAHLRIELRGEGQSCLLRIEEDGADPGDAAEGAQQPLRALVEEMGGQLDRETREPAGSCTSLRLRLAEEEAR